MMLYTREMYIVAKTQPFSVLTHQFSVVGTYIKYICRAIYARVYLSFTHHDIIAAQLITINSMTGSSDCIAR